MTEIILVKKNIFPKIKIHEATYFLLALFLFTGHIKNIIIIFAIVIFHELGHIFFLKHYHYKITGIEILPFGGLTKTLKYINTPIIHDIFIYFGGVFFQTIFYLIVFSIFHHNFIHESTYHMFIKYNTTILIFNLLPIRPLDGGEILRLFLEKYLPFSKAQLIANISSLIFLVLFFLTNITFNLNNYLICSFLLVKLCNLIKNQKLIENKFYVERLLYTFPYRKIQNEKSKKLQVLKKDTWHYFQNGQSVISEKKLLQEKFDILSHF